MNKKPTKLKILQGNPGKRPLPIEPHPKEIMPRMPKEIDREAKKAWKALAPTLVKLGLLCETDGLSFGFLCQLRSRLKECIEKTNSLSSLIDEKSYIDKIGEEHITCRINAYVLAEERFFKLFRAYAADFGLTPKGRTGLGIDLTGTKAGSLEGLLD